MSTGLSASAATPISWIGGSVIAIDADDWVVDQLVSLASWAEPRRSPREPSATYRQETLPDGRQRFTRHDERRDPPVERIGCGVDRLLDDLHLTIALHSPDDVFVHAGVVAWNGVAIVLPGRSRAGKSTLVDALVRAGATYLSDEYARITADGLISPYARPIQLRTPNGRRLVDARTIGEVGDRPVPPGLVVLTRFRDEAPFVPRSLSPAQTALELLDNTVIAEIDPERAAAAVARVARDALAIRSERGSAEAAAAAILAVADQQVAVA